MGMIKYRLRDTCPNKIQRNSEASDKRSQNESGHK